ncbi:MAG: ATP-binding protein [Ktedonobacterales bacterium]
MSISARLRRQAARRAMAAPSLPMSLARWLHRLSTFEKVIIANSVIIILDALAGWWITQHNPEAYHYLIDTLFIVLAVFLGLLVNFLLLRAAFAPLHALLTTIRAVEQGDLDARVSEHESDADVLVLARAFNSMLDQLMRTRNESAARVLRAQEEERRRLALELHDQTGQSLTALALHAEAIAHRLDGETSERATMARQQAERLSTLAQQTLSEVQALSRQLRPALLDDLGLAAALRWLAVDAQQRLGITLRLAVREPERLPSDIETALFRLVQECLTNAVRHGYASHAACLLRRDGDRVTLTIADNGQGFDMRVQRAQWMTYCQESASGTSKVSGGSGLEGMQARIRPLGGTLAIRTRPGHGCAVRAVIPLSSSMSRNG